MKELILHIGYGKTGSSALQSWLANNHKKLNQQGVMYAGVNEDAKSFRISSGNGAMLHEYLFNDGVSDQRLLDYYFGGFERAIVSSEQFQALRNGTPEALKLKEFLDKYNIRLHLIAFIRNIYNHFYSNYVQAIKRQGCLLTFDNWISDRLEIKPFECYQSLSRVWPMTLISYDNNIANLALAFCENSGIEYFELAPMSALKVNRTLSYSEIVLIQKLATRAVEHGYQSSIVAKVLSDDLVNLYPDRNTKVLLDKSIYMKILGKYDTMIRNFNIECEERFGFTIKILNDDGYFEFKDKEVIDFSVVSKDLSKIIVANKSLFNQQLVRAFCLELSKFSFLAALRVLIFNQKNS